MPSIKSLETMRFNWPDDAMGGWLEVRHLTEPIIQSIVISNTETVTTLDPDTKTVALAEKRDAAGIRDKVAIRAISDWGNFFDADGKELPCTPANICRFAEEDGFITTLNKFRQDLGKHIQTKREAAEKN